MVEAAQSRQRSNRGITGRLWLDGPPIRGVLVQGIVNAVLLVIAYVITDQAAKVLLIQRDEVIEDLAAAISGLRPGHGGRLCIFCFKFTLGRPRETRNKAERGQPPVGSPHLREAAAEGPGPSSGDAEDFMAEREDRNGRERATHDNRHALITELVDGGTGA